MHAEYDSEAKALRIDLIEAPKAAYGEEIGSGCIVAMDRNDNAVSVELLSPEAGLEPLGVAAERYGLDEEALLAAARAALAAPDRQIRIEVGIRSLA
jgi:hypothetical protein